jgi:hypothetical protein
MRMPVAFAPVWPIDFFTQLNQCDVDFQDNIHLRRQQHIIPTIAPTSVYRHCSYVTFMIGAFGLMWFAVGLGLVAYGANLGHELAACQVSGTAFS